MNVFSALVATACVVSLLLSGAQTEEASANKLKEVLGSSTETVEKEVDSSEAPSNHGKNITNLLPAEATPELDPTENCDAKEDVSKDRAKKSYSPIYSSTNSLLSKPYQAYKSPDPVKVYPDSMQIAPGTQQFSSSYPLRYIPDNSPLSCVLVTSKQSSGAPFFMCNMRQPNSILPTVYSSGGVREQSSYAPLMIRAHEHNSDALPQKSPAESSVSNQESPVMAEQPKQEPAEKPKEASSEEKKPKSGNPNPVPPSPSARTVYTPSLYYPSDNSNYPSYPIVYPVSEQVEPAAVKALPCTSCYRPPPPPPPPPAPCHPCSIPKPPPCHPGGPLLLSCFLHPPVAPLVTHSVVSHPPPPPPPLQPSPVAVIHLQLRPPNENFVHSRPACGQCTQLYRKAGDGSDSKKSQDPSQEPKEAGSPPKLPTPSLPPPGKETSKDAEEKSAPMMNYLQWPGEMMPNMQREPMSLGIPLPLSESEDVKMTQEDIMADLSAMADDSRVKDSGLYKRQPQKKGQQGRNTYYASGPASSFD